MKIGKLIWPLLNPIKWIKAGQYKRRQPAYERARKDLELQLYSKILNSDMLHYGYFDNPEVDPLSISIRDVEKAQKRYAEVIAEKVENRDLPVLDVGCGMGGLSAILFEQGINVEALSPDENQKLHINERYPDIQVYHTRFEDFEVKNRYGTVINSESIQYIQLDRAFELVDQLLEDDGRWIITDYFRLHEEGKSKSGHSFDKFKSAINESKWEIESEIDITENCLPTLKLVNAYVERFVIPGANFGVEKLKVKSPKLYYMTQHIREAISRKADKEFAAIDPDKFSSEKRYMLFVLKKSR